MASPSFENRVQDALAHLYDVAYLERSPLIEDLGLGQRRGGAALHRRLVEVIERLKPPREVAADAPAWKIYRALHLRYVRALSVATVAGELGLSVRQAQRVHLAALAAVATTLAEERPDDAGPGPTPPPPSPRALREPSPHRIQGDGRGVSYRPASETAPPAADSLLDDELAAILARARDHDDPLPAIVRGAVATVGPIVESRRATIDLALDEVLSQRVAPHDLVHPALVQLLLAALDRGQPRAVSVAAEIDAEEVKLVIAADARAPEAGADEKDALDRRLAVARRLLAAMGGQVTCRLGPEFQVDLRLPTAVAPTVLVVEDNPQVVQLFRRYFSGSPFQMAWAPNGGVAFELASTAPPAAITLDLLLPERDGWEFLQLARVHPATREIPVVVCSVLRERELALALGAADFLPKPVTQGALLGSLRRLVRRPEAARSG